MEDVIMHKQAEQIFKLEITIKMVSLKVSGQLIMAGMMIFHKTKMVGMRLLEIPDVI